MGVLKDEIDRSKSPYRKAVLEKLGMTEESVQADVEHLMQWLEKQAHLPAASHLNLETWLQNQLFMAKNSLERAKTNIDKYFTVRTTTPEIFQNRDVSLEKFNQSYENVTISYLDGLTPRLHKVCVLRIESSAADAIDFNNIMIRTIGAMDFYLKEGMEFTGFHVILDLSNLRMSHLTRLSVSNLKSLSTAAKAFPVSFTALNIVNCPSFIEKAMAIFRPFLSPKLFARLSIIKDINELQSLVGDVQLPNDNDGFDTPMQKKLSDSMRTKLISVKDYLAKCDALRCDESKRITVSALKLDDSCQMDGSFRKLCID